MRDINFLHKLGIEIPIIQAPMAGGATSPQLVAAVSNSGGLGSLAAGYMKADDIRQAICQIRTLTNKPFAVNLFIPEKHHASPQEIQQACQIIEKSCGELNIKINALTAPFAESFSEQMRVLAEEKISAFSFTFGIPDAQHLAELKKNGTILIGTATNVAEAQLLEKSGVDAIVAQGSEAGGHRGTFIGKANDSLIGIISLLPQIVDNTHIPVIAAGGIMDARGIKAVLTLGADCAQMGTVFLTCTESGTHPKYKELLLTLTDDKTILTTAFSGKLARGIRNKFINRLGEYKEHIPDYPIQNALTRDMRKEAAKQNCVDFMSMWAGQSAYLCRELPASILIDELMAEIRESS